MMDAEAALLEGSPTMSTISSDYTDQTYATDSTAAPSPDSPTLVTPMFKAKTLVDDDDDDDDDDGDDEDEEDEEEDDEHEEKEKYKYDEESLTPPKIIVVGTQIRRKHKIYLRPPYLMICISVIQIAVYFLGPDVELRDWLVYDPRRRIQGWRFISYMLLHSNFPHLAMNVAIQLVLATLLEMEQNRLSVGAIYIGGGVCGALGASLLQRDVYLIGASAGVYALLTSHLAHLYLCHGELRYAGWRLMTILMLVVADVASMPVPALLGCPRIGWAAHVAGALAGPLLGLAIFPRQSKKDARGRSFVRFVRIVSGVSVLLLFVGAILGNIYLISLPQIYRPS